jgi:hypothetical protein
MQSPLEYLQEERKQHSSNSSVATTPQKSINLPTVFAGLIAVIGVVYLMLSDSKTGPVSSTTSSATRTSSEFSVSDYLQEYQQLDAVSADWSDALQAYQVIVQTTTEADDIGMQRHLDNEAPASASSSSATGLLGLLASFDSIRASLQVLLATRADIEAQLLSSSSTSGAQMSITTSVEDVLTSEQEGEQLFAKLQALHAEVTECSKTLKSKQVAIMQAQNERSKVEDALTQAQLEVEVHVNFQKQLAVQLDTFTETKWSYNHQIQDCDRDRLQSETQYQDLLTRQAELRDTIRVLDTKKQELPSRDSIDSQLESLQFQVDMIESFLSDLSLSEHTSMAAIILAKNQELLHLIAESNTVGSANEQNEDDVLMKQAKRFNERKREIFMLELQMKLESLQILQNELAEKGLGDSDGAQLLMETKHARSEMIKQLNLRLQDLLVTSASLDSQLKESKTLLRNLQNLIPEEGSWNLVCDQCKLAFAKQQETNALEITKTKAAIAAAKDKQIVLKRVVTEVQERQVAELSSVRAQAQEVNTDIEQCDTKKAAELSAARHHKIFSEALQGKKTRTSAVINAFIQSLSERDTLLSKLREVDETIRIQRDEILKKLKTVVQQ